MAGLANAIIDGIMKIYLTGGATILGIGLLIVATCYYIGVNKERKKRTDKHN